MKDVVSIPIAQGDIQKKIFNDLVKHGETRAFRDYVKTPEQRPKQFYDLLDMINRLKEAEYQIKVVQERGKFWDSYIRLVKFPTCPGCDGRGEVTDAYDSAFGTTEYFTHLCEWCDGKGHYIEKEVYREVEV